MRPRLLCLLPLLLFYLVCTNEQRQAVSFLASDENCVEKVKEATTCVALAEENFNNCRSDADADALAASNESNTVVAPNYEPCDNDRIVLQAFCGRVVYARCL
jgi:hypothetical protein